MPVDVTTEIVINCEPAAVAAYASDPAHVPNWYANIKQVHWETPPPLRLGTRVRFVAQFLGRELVYTYEVIEYIAGQRLIMRTAEGPFPMETTYTWAPVPDGATRMTLRNRGEPSGFSRIAAPLMSMMIRKENQKDLARLKQILERGGF